ncbi:MAG TPA: hypothetical protein VMF29_04170 [Candidatus Edwardsbacteria bacterium]|nr:hypothetical protein [Candidatus Edwardsbacteria bacterium]
MDHVRTVQHRGREIIVLDLKGVADLEVSLAAVAAAEALIRTRPPASVLLITDVSGAHYDVTGVEALKNFSHAITPYVKASAAVGITGIKSVIIRSLNRLTGRSIRIIDDLEQAKDWLISQ